MEDFEVFEQIMRDGMAYVDCTACEHSDRVEPDGDYECPVYGCDGRLTSPLITAGLI